MFGILVDVSSAELLPASPGALVGGVGQPDAPDHVSRDAPDRGERDSSAGQCHVPLLDTLGEVARLGRRRRHEAVPIPPCEHQVNRHIDAIDSV